jgi:UDP-N-acetylmuramate dehydrogenase
MATEGRPDLTTIRRAIVAIRRAKLPDPGEIGNAGSFFKNPVVDAGTLTAILERWPDLPHFAQAGGRFKLPAGWMIERCGWKGRRLGQAGVHHRQALVLVNLGGATGRDVLELSEQIHTDVQARFGIGLEREVQIVGKLG